MPEILFLCEFVTLNGGERSMLAVLDGVRAAGFGVAVLAPGGGPLVEALAAKDIEHLPFEFHDPEGRRWPQGRLREHLAAALVRRRPAILHANSLAMGRLSGPVAAELRLPSLSHLRDIVRLSRQAVADLNRHARLLAVSQATQTYHVAHGVEAQRVHVVYNGVDLEEFRPRQPTGWLHAELGLPRDVPLVGLVGQIGLRKGHDTLLHAAARLSHGWPRVHYVIVGGRHSDKDESRRYEQKLYDMATETLPGRVHFLGVRSDVGRLLAELAILAHPARQEPLGRVLLESAASGLAIVASDVGGTREIFPPEAETARIVAPNDPAALAGALDELLSDPDLRIRLGNAARRRAVERFGVQQSLSALVTHYAAVFK